ncbi:conserved hypothetical protein [Leishmania major strain Friedlin]|uniref:Uncharacterized protein n=1 Tax=Leishmania major TaxID=5664 RepID=Q4Q9I6_LEIMA|nr:conserved hypothetical protein [Leishmania major strain Friedlin]CAG9576236.1 hypothetical_protein_-_conserved [Leishmania major strain Friedlin]CAJ04469.1 conserved hypothetical protein [Leishmania major strain Friedlin]|eukprot:XP_001684012.1 conserved hypothetical protein [Leishmania major strain Friedlin]
MDVSQFLKSFKKNVAAKSKRSSSVRQSDEAANSGAEEDVTEIFHSASDSEADGEAEDGEVILGGRADKMAGKRYTRNMDHSKRNREFAALKVVETNSVPAVEAGRFQRQRAALARQATDARKPPRTEMIASVRAELLRQREKLRGSNALDSANQLDASVQKMETTMIEVEDLLQASAPTAATSASVLDFLPAAPLPAPRQATLTTASRAASIAVALSEPQPPSSSVTNGRAGTPTVNDPALEEPPKLPKKRTKFELAMAMAHDEVAS